MDLRANEAVGAVTLSGSPADIGVQIGKRFSDSIRRSCEACVAQPPPLKGLEVTERLHQADKRLRADFPEVYAEMVATAQAAGITFRSYLLALYEELWDEAEDPKPTWTLTRGCTDILARKSATKSGELLVGHNNDVDPNASNTVLLQYVPQNGVSFLAASIDGFSISTAANSRGFVFTGNEVTAKDGKGGIPRLVLMRIACQAPTLQKALETFRYEGRASAYNNIVSDSTGQAVNLEGSATKTTTIPFQNDLFAHTNHYLKLKDKQLGKSGVSSVYRLETAKKLLEAQRGAHTVESFKSILSQHQEVRGGICRHGEEDVSTRFAVVAEPQKGLLHYCANNPCNGGFVTLSYWE